MMGLLPLGEQYWVESCVVVFFFVALGIFKHRTNIVRLLHGTENKLGQKAQL
jgi:glycerol-3-phosphate acyltransferase PlsY